MEPTDIEKIINDTTRRSLVESQLISDISSSIPLLVNAIKWNPREVKRFINNIILIQAVFGKPVDELIVIQALNFRHEWNKFLILMTPEEKRQNFLKEYQKHRTDHKAIVIKNVDAFNKEVSNEYPSFGEILESYPSFFEQNNDLRSFLDAGADNILAKITDMEGHRRALSAVSVEGVTKRIRSTGDVGENLFFGNLPYSKAYVLYYPGAMPSDVLENKLRSFGTSTGNNLFVNIGRLDDPDFDQIQNMFEIKELPVIIVTGSEGIASLKSENSSTAYVRLDSKKLLQDPDNTIKVIERLCNLFISGELSEALQETKHDKPNAIISYIKNNVINKLKDEDITVSLLDGKFELRTKRD